MGVGGAGVIQGLGSACSGDKTHISLWLLDKSEDGPAFGRPSLTHLIGRKPRGPNTVLEVG